MHLDWSKMSDDVMNLKWIRNWVIEDEYINEYLFTNAEIEIHLAYYYNLIDISSKMMNMQFNQVKLYSWFLKL